MLPSIQKPPMVKREIIVDDSDLINSKLTPPVVELDLGEVMTTLTKFGSSSNVQKMTKDINIERRQLKFTTKMTDVLEQLKKLNIDSSEIEPLFLFCLQSATDYLHEHEPESLEDICADLLKPLCNNDVVLTKQIIKMVRKNIKSSTFWRRNKRKICKFFFSWVKK